MSLSGIIRRGDRQPLGSPEQVKTRLNKTFPGTQFTLVHESSVTQPKGFELPSGFGLVSLLFWLFKPRYPYWEGSFEAGKFAAVFELGAGPTVKHIWSRDGKYGRPLRHTLRANGLANKISWILACQRFDPRCPNLRERFYVIL